MMLMYDTTPMPESKLPPVYIRKEHKRLKMDPSGERRFVIKAFINSYVQQNVNAALSVVTYFVAYTYWEYLFLF